MKKIILVLIAIMSILVCAKKIYAEELEEFDISEWSYTFIKKHADQDYDVKICKFYNVNDRSKYAFCIEPSQKFKPVGANYFIDLCKDEYIYNLVKAYDKIGFEDDNYYIAAQLLIWNHIDGSNYTFDGNDYSEYKRELLGLCNPKKVLLSDSIETYEAYLNEDIIIENDYTDFDIKGEGIDVIENNEENLIIRITKEEPIEKNVVLTPLDNDENHAHILLSEESQDLYYFDYDYSDLKPFTLKVNTLKKPSKITINYSKVDENDVPIKGAEFSLYEISDNGDMEISFIKKGVEVNLYEALLDDHTKFSSLSIDVSERYSKYLNDATICTDELGYFPYRIYDNNYLIKQGVVYVTDDVNDSDSYFNSFTVKRIFKGFSDDKEINSITDIDSNSSYYLCESEPKKGYTYVNKPCNLVDGSNYDGKPYKFINKNRTYTLKLTKNGEDNVLLNGALFKLNYYDNGNNRNLLYATGSLCIERENDAKYVIYKYENDENVVTEEFNSDTFVKSNVKEGKYYYYLSNDRIVNNSLLYDKYKEVKKGEFIIENIPYSSRIIVEELEAPEGYDIGNPIFYIEPDLDYSDIVFNNYRINYLDIVPGKKFKVPKTCIN